MKDFFFDNINYAKLNSELNANIKEDGFILGTQQDYDFFYICTV